MGLLNKLLGSTKPLSVVASECNSAMSAGDYVHAARLAKDFTRQVTHSDDPESEIKLAHGYLLLARATYEMARTATPRERQDVLVGFFLAYVAGQSAFQSLIGIDAIMKGTSVQSEYFPAFEELNTLYDSAYEKFSNEVAEEADLRANEIFSDAERQALLRRTFGY